MSLDQLIIPVTGVPAIWMSQAKRESFRRWAPIIAMIGQPSWFYMTWKAQQWGAFGMCFLYTGGWLFGLYNYWLKKKEQT